MHPHLDHQMRQQLVRELCAILDGWTATEVVGFLGIHPARVSELRRGRVQGFTIDRLLRWIGRLGYDATLTLAPLRPPRREFVCPSASVVRQDRFGRPLDQSQPGRGT